MTKYICVISASGWFYYKELMQIFFKFQQTSTGSSKEVPLPGIVKSAHKFLFSCIDRLRSPCAFCQAQFVSVKDKTKKKRQLFNPDKVSQNTSKWPQTSGRSVARIPADARTFPSIKTPGPVLEPNQLPIQWATRSFPGTPLRSIWKRNTTMKFRTLSSEIFNNTFQTDE